MPTSEQKSLNSKNKFFFVSGIIFLTLCLAAFASWYTLSSNSSESLSSQLERYDAFKFPQALPVSDVPFINEEGETVSKKQNKGKWSFIFFGYTFCPDICPTTLSVMQQMWLQLTPDIKAKTQIAFVSIDIERDTPEQLKTYMDYFDPDFTALTGNPASLHILAAELNAVYAKVDRLNEDGEVDPDLGYLMDHSANMSILDPNGNYYGFIKPPFTPKKMLAIVNAIHSAQKP